MTILNQILTLAGIRKTQATFLNTLLVLWLAIPGRINYANLERFSNFNEKTYRNWFAKPVPWIALNTSLVQTLQSQQRMGTTLIIGIDASNNRKAGKHTHGIAKFWDSKQGKAVSSLEISCCTLIDLEYRQAIPIHALQTPAELPEDESRATHYAKHLETSYTALPELMKKQIKCAVGDAFYSKKSFVDRVIECGLCFVGKLRTDANLRMLYTGPRSKKAGRPKRYADKVDWNDLSGWNLEHSDETCTIHSARVNSPSLKRDLRVVCITWFVSEGKTRREVLFSTDVYMPAMEVIECYRARFEMEFPFRDAKQFAGLMDCQSRQAKALEFHWNASFLVTSLTRAQQLLDFDGDVRNFVFSMEDSKRRAYNELFAERIIRLLPLELSFEKYILLLEDVLNLGVKTG
jgi:DDE superfamily endonuclease